MGYVKSANGYYYKVARDGKKTRVGKEEYEKKCAAKSQKQLVKSSVVKSTGGSGKAKKSRGKKMMSGGEGCQLTIKEKSNILEQSISYQLYVKKNENENEDIYVADVTEDIDVDNNEGMNVNILNETNKILKDQGCAETDKTYIENLIKKRFAPTKKRQNDDDEENVAKKRQINDCTAKFSTVSDENAQREDDDKELYLRCPKCSVRLSNNLYNNRNLIRNPEHADGCECAENVTIPVIPEDLASIIIQGGKKRRPSRKSRGRSRKA